MGKISRGQGINKFLLLLIVLLIGFIFFFLSKDLYFNVLGDPKNESGLKSRYEALLALDKNKKYGEIYDQFLLETEKEKTSREKYITDGTTGDKKRADMGIVSMEHAIHSITIKDNIGFIDRTLAYCYDTNCAKRETRRVYKKWVYVNNRWYITTESPTCIRDARHDKPPEFDRALSLIAQRLQQVFGEKGKIEVYLNCVDIEYSNFMSEEGVFFFDRNISSPERLVIHVNSSYKVVDDLTTAILLTHELTHAGQYLDYLYDNKPQDCIDQEVEAFLWQFFFVRALNNEELMTIVTRALLLPGFNNQIQIIYKDLLPIHTRAGNICSSLDSQCYVDELKNGIKTWVESNPHYRKQCSLR